MGQDVRNESRFCQIPHDLKKGLNLHLRTRAIIVAVSLTFILTSTGLVYYLMRPGSLPFLPDWEKRGRVVGTPHAAIAIDGDANFSATALLEGWPGDGSPENPYIINGLDIDLDGEFGHCIDIWSTRVSFTISNCNLTGAVSMSGVSTSWGAGIALHNVSNGVLVNNTCSSNDKAGIISRDSTDITIMNNTCYNNGLGILLLTSNTNVVANNICNSNGYAGISLSQVCVHNTVANNICNNNNQWDDGIGIDLYGSDHNTVVNNTCLSNAIGINISFSRNNTLVNNICTGNTEHDIYLYNSNIITEITIIVVPLLIGFAGIIVLGAGWRMVKLLRVGSKEM